MICAIRRKQIIRFTSFGEKRHPRMTLSTCFIFYIKYLNHCGTLEFFFQFLNVLYVSTFYFYITEEQKFGIWLYNVYY